MRDDIRSHTQWITDVKSRIRLVMNTLAQSKEMKDDTSSNSVTRGTVILESYEEARLIYRMWDRYRDAIGYPQANRNVLTYEVMNTGGMARLDWHTHFPNPTPNLLPPLEVDTMMTHVDLFLDTLWLNCEVLQTGKERNYIVIIMHNIRCGDDRVLNTLINWADTDGYAQIISNHLVSAMTIRFRRTYMSNDCVCRFCPLNLTSF